MIPWNHSTGQGEPIETTLPWSGLPPTHLPPPERPKLRRSWVAFAVTAAVAIFLVWLGSSLSDGSATGAPAPAPSPQSAPVRP